MNNRTYWVMLFVLVASLAASCTKTGLITYNAPDDIYFDYRRGVNLAQNSKGFPEDSLDFTFAFTDASITDSILPMPLLVAGKPSDHDRVVNLVVDPASTAIPGKHFQLPNPMIVRAGMVADTIFIKMLRDPELKTKQVTLLLQIQPNENFGNNMLYKYRDLSASLKDTIELTKFKLKVSDMLIKGPLWDQYMAYFFGPYSEKKIRLMEQVAGMPLSFAASTSYTNEVITMPSFYATVMGRYLREQAANGNTVYEDDGTPMLMHPDYQ